MRISNMLGGFGIFGILVLFFTYANVAWNVGPRQLIDFSDPIDFKRSVFITSLITALSVLSFFGSIASKFLGW